MVLPELSSLDELPYDIKSKLHWSDAAMDKPGAHILIGELSS